MLIRGADHKDETCISDFNVFSLNKIGNIILPHKIASYIPFIVY